MTRKRVYLDHQASTPMAPAALDEMLPCFSACYANPHSEDHAAGWEAAEYVEAARGRVATAIAAEPDEVVFTSGATEANNLALLGLMDVRPQRRRVIVSALEHKSVRATVHAMAVRGCEVVVVPVDRLGFVDMVALDDAVTGDTLVVSIGSVNSEIGTVQDVAAVAAICRRVGALLHSDASQGLAWNAVSVDALGVDLLSLSAHKAGGPKGIGALFVGALAASALEPMIHGGGQERGLRSGTLPTPLCVGFGAACSALPSSTEVSSWREKTECLLDRLRSVMPSLLVNGSMSPRHPGNLSIRFPGVPADILAARLQPWVAVARGSACTSGQPEPSYVLRSIGLSADASAECLRISTSRDTSPEDIDLAIHAFSDVLSGFI